MSYKEIAMLLRNGENQQFIITETVRRKLMQALSSEEEQTLLSLRATPALIATLHDPAVVASSQDLNAYVSHVQQQQMLVLQEEQAAQRLAAQAAAQARLQQLQKPAAPAKPGEAGAPPSDYTGKPLTLKFDAADGTPVDLAKLHGKVVLVDFWATWCGPCMKEVPNVVAAYAKYHAKGFEIVGISLDQDKDKMFKVMAQKGMTWPQYFDGKGWSNEVATSFQIRSIPSMWLVNKNGIIATTNARGSLDAEIEKLLAE